MKEKEGVENMLVDSFLDITMLGTLEDMELDDPEERIMTIGVAQTGIFGESNTQVAMGVTIDFDGPKFPWPEVCNQDNLRKQTNNDIQDNNVGHYKMGRGDPNHFSGASRMSYHRCIKNKK